jgi:putative transposase
VDRVKRSKKLSGSRAVVTAEPLSAEIKTVPYVPLSHPFVERLIGTIRREYLDRSLFWSTIDLERKLLDFQNYYNAHRTHSGLNGRLPDPTEASSFPLNFGSYRWRRHCRGLYQTFAA